MLCKEVMDILEENYPADYALNWDNVGPVSYTHLTLPTT